MRILLVEDESDLGEAIQRSSSHEKYVVDWVQNGKKAWNYLNNPQVHYTVAILDWLLPGLSGVELCQRLRSPKSVSRTAAHKLRIPLAATTAISPSL